MFVRWKLENGQKRAAKHPDTFHIPSPQEIEALKPGDYVKLIFTPLESEDVENTGSERMWVEIDEILGNEFHGGLANEPVVIEDMNLGDPVTFRAHHVIDIHVSREE